MNVTLEIAGMTCGHCVKSVTEALAAVPGTAGAAVDVGRASWRTDRPPDEAALRAALEEAGYEITAVRIDP